MHVGPGQFLGQPLSATEDKLGRGIARPCRVTFPEVPLPLPPLLTIGQYRPWRYRSRVICQ